MYQRAAGAPQADILGFKYDFRFYSLQLFGGVLVYWSLRGALCAFQLAKGSSTASRRAWRNIAYILLVVAPLPPMHVLAVATTVLMAIASIGLLTVAGFKRTSLRSAAALNATVAGGPARLG